MMHSLAPVIFYPGWFLFEVPACMAKNRAPIHRNRMHARQIAANHANNLECILD